MVVNAKTLQRSGFKVNLSELNGFEKDLRVNSYEACLQTVRNSDFFILLVGSEKGEVCKEYQEAYTNFINKGTPTIITFVRKDAWADRKIESDITNGNQVLRFLDEIASKHQMKTATSLEHLPHGNRIHTFTTFADIYEVLKPMLQPDHNAQQNIAMAAIRRECTQNLQQLYIEADGVPIPVTQLVSPATLQDAVTKKNASMPADATHFLDTLLALDPVLTTTACQHAKTTKVFHVFSPESIAPQFMPIHEALEAMHTNVESFCALFTYCQQSATKPSVSQLQKLYIATYNFIELSEWLVRYTARQDPPPYKLLHAKTST